MTLPYPVDVAGYLDFPGTPNNYAAFNRTALSSLTILQFTVRVRFDVLTAGATLCAWNNGDARLVMSTALRPAVQVTNTSSVIIGGAAASADIPGLTAGMDVWIRGKVTVSNAQCVYWYSLEDQIDATKVTWTALGTAVTGTGSGTTPKVASSAATNLGNFLSTGLFNGRMYYFSEEDSGTETLRFDGMVDLAGVPGDADSLKPSVGPVGTLLTFTRKAVAASQGSLTLYGNPGNYATTPDVSALDITNNMAIITRVRAIDLAPANVGIALASKAATTGQYSFALTCDTTGEIGLTWSSAGTTTSHLSAPIPTAVSANQWVWLSQRFTGTAVKLWYSTVDSLTPPQASDWTVLGAPTMGSTTIFSGSSPLNIGVLDSQPLLLVEDPPGSGLYETIPPPVEDPPGSGLYLLPEGLVEDPGSGYYVPSGGLTFEGDIGYLAYGTRTVDDPVTMTTTVLALTADNFIGLPPDAATITPAVGGAITVVRTPSPKGTGYLDLPGTKGNCLSVPDSATLDLTGSFVIAARITPYFPLPNTITEQTIVSKWGLAGHRSYAWQIDSSGRLVLQYSPDGTASTFLRSSQILSYHLPQWVLASSWYSGGVRSVRFWRSPDRRTWTEVGTVQTATTAEIFASDSPVIIGASFHGRISGAFINTGAVNGTPSGNVEVLRLDSEHLAVDPAVPSFPIVGGTATVFRTQTPVDFGYLDFPGTTGNYVTVPDATNLRVTNNFCVTARITPDDATPRNTDRILIRKWAASPNMGWQLLYSTVGTLKFVYSTNGTTFTTVESPNVGLDNYYAKRVAFSYSTSLGGQFWISDDNVNWSTLGTSFALASPAFASTAVVEIGHTFPGAMSEVSIRTPLAALGSPVIGNEMLLIDQTCLHIDPDSTSFTATTGQTVTVLRDDVSIVHGNVRFTGTEGNYLSTPDHATLDISGSIGFVFRLAPDEWKPKTAQSFIAKWDDGSVANANYLVRLSPNGTFLFSYTSLDGLTDVTIESPAPTDTVDGEFRFFYLSVDFAATKTLRLFESRDMGDTWVQLGAPVTATAGDATMKTGASQLIIGAQNLDVGHFSGRISYLEIRNGVGTGGILGGTSAFLIDAEALHILVTDNTFTDHTGKVVTLHQADTPVEPGWLSFGGVAGEYMHAAVPSFTTTGDFSIVARLSLSVPEGAETTDDDEQVVFEKWVAPNLSFSLRRSSKIFTLDVSVDGATSTFRSASPEWPLDPSDDTAPSEWGWLGVTCKFASGTATVSWFYVTDEVTPYGTPLFPDTWPLWGVRTSYTAASMHNLASQPVTFGTAALPFHGSISDLYLLAGTATDGSPGGSNHFVFDLESFFGITSDSGAFTAVTGQNVVLEPVGVERTMYIEPTPTGPVLFVSPSPPGPTTEILPAPLGPVLTIQPASAGPTAVIVASNQGPQLSLYSPSLDRPWWPGSNNPDPSTWWDQPAFTVQRQVIGDIVGGDFVRGSSNVLTEQTAIRFLTRLAGWTEAGVGKGLLYAVPYWKRDPYHTVEIEWNMPQELLFDFDTWSEVAIVRSAMGNPLTVNDGQTIYRDTKTSIFPTGAYLVNADDNVITPNVYDPYPYDPTGGQPGLPSGRWYYYGLFFRVGKDWVRSATTYTLLPRNFGHSDYLWDSLPPYYRWVDDQQQSTMNGGDLRRFLKIFGYELDFTRELVESWQDLYHTDFTPMQLLKRIGDNFGVPYEPGIGDPCYRALVSRLGFLYHGRGTSGALRQMVGATAKCDCDLTQSENMLLLPDDSDFFTGTGNWASLNPATVLSGAGIPTTPLTPDKVFVEHGLYNRPAPATGRGSMHVWTSKTDATSNLIITCGDGILYYFDDHDSTDPHGYTWLLVSTAPPKTFLPRFTATLVQEGTVLGFDVSVRSDLAGVTATPMIIFFTDAGMPQNIVSTELPVTPTVLAANTWTLVTVSGPVPDTAMFAVPAVAFSTRPAGSDPTLSPMIHFDAAGVYILGSTEEVSSTDIDRYLTLGVTTELLGPPNTGTGFPGYLLGDQLT